MKKLLLVVLTLSLPCGFTSAQADGIDDVQTVTLWASPARPAQNTAPSHRIPAIVRCGDGSLLAVCDYRYNLSDVGVSGSQIELQYRRSADGGQTWTPAQTVCQKVSTRSSWKYAMGDASLIADRESGEVLMMCAAGSTGMGASSASNPIKVGQFRSTDNGATWDEGEDITSRIYGLYNGNATALFITSGSLKQSRYIKVGDYYRIYAAYPLRTARNGNTTGVMFSDDFGRTWNVLGGPTTFPTGSVYEEGKVEEMPDGSVVLMVRDDAGKSVLTAGKKNFNVFTYTDSKKGEGTWSNAVSGITGMKNACNNGILLVPAKRVADGGNVYVAVVALPFHTNDTRDAVNNYGRKSVGFYYKEIASVADYATGASMASGWQRGVQVTDKLSAYTDLVQLPDGNIGLLAEDNGKQGLGADGNAETEAYDIVFRSIPLELITNDAYTTDLTYEGREAFMDERIQLLTGATAGTVVGMLDASDPTIAAYEEEKTQETFESVMKAAAEGTLKRITIEEGRTYVIRSAETAEAYANSFWGVDIVEGMLETQGVSADYVDGHYIGLGKENLGAAFTFEKVDDGLFKVYHQNAQAYLQATPARLNGNISLTDDVAAAGLYRIKSDAEGNSVFTCENPGVEVLATIGQNADGELLNQLSSAEGVKFNICPVEAWQVEFQKVSDEVEGAYAAVCLPFDAELPEGVSAHLVKSVAGKVAATEAVEAVPAGTPVILKSVLEAGSVPLTIPAERLTPLTGENLLHGVWYWDGQLPTSQVYTLGVENGCVSLVEDGCGILSDNTAYFFRTAADSPAAFYYLDINGSVPEEQNPYDLNKDGAVDVSDVTLLVGYILTPSGEGTGMDLNADGVVDVSDVTLLVGYILSQEAE